MDEEAVPASDKRLGTCEHCGRPWLRSYDGSGDGCLTPECPGHQDPEQRVRRVPA